MAITKEVLDELLKEYKGPDDFYGPEGIIKQLSKALIERAMQTELTEQIGYEKSESGEKPNGNRRNGKSSKTLRTDQGPMEIEVPRDRKELRAKTDTHEFRVAYIFDPKRKGLLLIGGDKKGKNQKKFYKDLIREAEEIYASYLEKFIKDKEK